MSNDAPREGDVPPWLDPELSDGERSLDTLVDALADRRARYAVSVLESRPNEGVKLWDLVDSVTKREVRAERDDITLDDADLDDAELEAIAHDDPEDRRQQVALSLHHRSLPKLDDAAVLDYDPRSNTVRYWDDGRASAYLEFFDREANV